MMKNRNVENIKMDNKIEKLLKFDDLYDEEVN